MRDGQQARFSDESSHAREGLVDELEDARVAWERAMLHYAVGSAEEEESWQIYRRLSEEYWHVLRRRRG